MTQRLPSFEDEGAKEPTRSNVLELVTADKVFRPAQMRELLGVGMSTYYKICRLGLLRYSRMTPGGPRVHTQQQYQAYIRYLNENAVAVEQRFPRRVSR